MGIGRFSKCDKFQLVLKQIEAVVLVCIRCLLVKVAFTVEFCLPLGTKFTKVKGGSIDGTTLSALMSPFMTKCLQGK